MSDRGTPCVASRGAAGVYCQPCPLTAGVSRVARAPALIPLCARLRTAVPETEVLNFANKSCRPYGGLVSELGGCHKPPSLAKKKGETWSRGFSAHL